jgi:hypothetical protein
MQLQQQMMGGGAYGGYGQDYTGGHMMAGATGGDNLNTSTNSAGASGGGEAG